MSTDDRARVCVLGSINMDLVVRVPRLPAPGETLLGGSFESHPGGKGANQAVGAARLGARVTMIGAVGDDEHARRMRATLEREGIDCSRVRAAPGMPTGVALITVSDGGENTIAVAPGANAALTPADADAARDAIAAADVLLAQLEVPLETVTRAACLAADAGTTVILNAAPAPGRLPHDLLGALNALVVNETEASIVAPPLRAATRPEASGPHPHAGLPGPGAPEPTPADPLLARLSELGVATTLLTLGPRGALYTHARAAGHVPAYAVEPVDTVGAGDAFCAAFAVRFAEHQSHDALDRDAVLDAMCWASAAGALATTRPGAIPSLPTRAELVAFLKRR